MQPDARDAQQKPARITGSTGDAARHNMHMRRGVCPPVVANENIREYSKYLKYPEYPEYPEYSSVAESSERRPVHLPALLK
jgi:hypothetical protein